ncbi:MAG TPA: tetratricopeptide repeat protein [Asticcacaulis sp.]|nr:tetratricopeptide repeat protein [Asticcacaulis sp.]
MNLKQLAATTATVFLLSTGHSLASPPLTTGWEKAAMSEVETAANAGNGQAQWELGRRYCYFKATKDDVKALYWFEKAAQQAVPWAEYETATMYELGEGTRTDSQKAMFWYRKSEADGIDRADTDIGLMYMEGDGVAKDEAEAIRWLQKGVDAGEVRAETLLGQYYRDGTGVPQNAAKAQTLLRAAVKQKHANAATVLEGMYRDGKGVPADPITAHAWRTMAYYLNNLATITANSKGEYAMLYTPNLSEEDNMKAWTQYKAFMLELGLAQAEPPGPDGSTPESVARDYFKDAASRSLQGPYKP